MSNIIRLQLLLADLLPQMRRVLSQEAMPMGIG
jgi:hypothetical protein